MDGELTYLEQGALPADSLAAHYLSKARMALKLTPTQRAVLSLVALGYTNEEVAAALGVSRNVVRNHLSKLFKRIGVRNRVEAVLKWYNLPIERP